MHYKFFLVGLALTVVGFVLFVYDTFLAPPSCPVAPFFCTQQVPYVSGLIIVIGIVIMVISVMIKRKTAR